MAFSIQEYLRHATQQFLNIGIDTANLDARILLEFVTGFSTEKLLVNQSLELSEQQIKHYQELIDQRLRFKPIAYIIGYKEFYENHKQKRLEKTNKFYNLNEITLDGVDRFSIIKQFIIFRNNFCNFLM